MNVVAITQTTAERSEPGVRRGIFPGFLTLPQLYGQAGVAF